MHKKYLTAILKTLEIAKQKAETIKTDKDFETLQNFINNEFTGIRARIKTIPEPQPVVDKPKPFA